MYLCILIKNCRQLKPAKSLLIPPLKLKTNLLLNGNGLACIRVASLTIENIS